MILETVLWWMPRSDAMRFTAVPSVCADRIDATTSAFAFLMSEAALAWQVISWRRSGPRVRVAAINGVGGDPDRLVDFIGIRATNQGRLSTEVTGAGFLLTNNQTIQAIEDAFGLPIQLTEPLNPGGRVSVLYKVDGLRRGLQQANDPAPTRAPMSRRVMGGYWGRRFTSVNG